MSLPDPHELEQEGAFHRGMAAVARTYFLALVREGFEPDEARFLLAHWQAAFLAVTHAPDRPQPEAEAGADPS